MLISCSSALQLSMITKPKLYILHTKDVTSSCTFYILKIFAAYTYSINTKVMFFEMKFSKQISHIFTALEFAFICKIYITFLLQIIEWLNFSFIHLEIVQKCTFYVWPCLGQFVLNILIHNCLIVVRFNDQYLNQTILFLLKSDRGIKNIVSQCTVKEGKTRIYKCMQL